MAPRPHILTIGNFDGVHLGHVELLARALAIADASTERGIVTALVLDPHPHAVLKPEEPAPDRITTFEQRRDLLLACGADEVERLTPTPELLGREPEAFIEGLVEAYAPTWFVEGHDFRFGKARRGDEFLLRELGERLGFGLTVVDEHLVALENQSLVRASSSIARWLIAHGRMSDAAHVLGRPYRIEEKIDQLSLRLKIGEDVDVVDPSRYDRFEAYAEEYHRLLGRRGASPAAARTIVRTHFTAIAALMVRMGDADAMIAGPVTTFRPELLHVLDVIGLKSGVSAAAALQVLILNKGIFFITDTHVTENPTPEEVCQSAILAAEQVRRFEIGRASCRERV